MAYVPLYPDVLTNVDDEGNEIRAALPVRGGGQWQSMANAVAWVLGKGSTIAMVGPYLDLDAANGFACYAYPHPQNTNWLWILTLARTNSGANVFGHFEGAQGTDLGGWQLDSSVPLHTPQTFFFIETFDPALSSTEEFTAALYVDSTSTSVEMVHLSATELPASDMTTFGAGDDVVEPSTCATNAPIFEIAGATAHASASGLAEIAYSISSGYGLIAEGRRVTLFSWASPVGVSTTSGSYVDLGMVQTAAASKPSIVGRHMYNGVITTTVRVGVYALVEGAPNTGAVRVTAASGANVVINITSGTLAWYFGNLTVETEDMSRNATDGGIRGGTRETFIVEGGVSGGSTALGVFALHIGESDTY